MSRSDTDHPAEEMIWVPSGDGMLIEAVEPSEFNRDTRVLDDLELWLLKLGFVMDQESEQADARQDPKTK